MSLHVHLVPTLAGAAVGDLVVVDGPEAHHAVAVRRLRGGEQVVLTDGCGRAVVGAVTSTTKAVFEARVISVDDVPRPAPELVVVQALPKGDRGELAVEVLTEVGVDRIVPWAAERCQVSWSGERGVRALSRWRSTAREAAKQSRRSWFPQVSGLVSTDEVAQLVTSADLAVVLHEATDRPLSAVVGPEVGTVLVVVGPEGGLGDVEVATFQAAGAVICRLGSEVLRTSTAGVVASAVLLARTSRWR